MNITRHYKDIEAKVHENLYNNIFCLTASYPTTNEFDGVFKRDMFVRNNKAAFHQVIHYLLNALNPELTKQRITSWPIYEIRMENKFRSEVHHYINELNSIYKNANLPPLMASHLIAPGGFKFARFMMKLSQLVLVEHLKKNKEIAKELTLPCMPCKNVAEASNVIEDLKLKTKNIERDTKEKYDKFMDYYQSVKQKANSIELELSELNKKLGRLKLERGVNQKQLEQTPSNYSNYNEAVKELDINMQFMENFNNSYSTCSDLISHLLNNNLRLKADQTEVNTANNPSFYFNGNLDLIEALQYLTATLEKINSKLPSFDHFQVQSLLERLEVANEKYSQLNAKFDKHQSELIDKMGQLQINFNNSSIDADIRKLSISDEPLAVPLECSDEEKT